jgi:nucleotide-binding universal stress UspA family protein
MNKILVPSDFSDQANNAFDLALDLSRKSGAALHLLHVIEPVTSTVGMTMPGTYMDNSMDQVFMMQLLSRSKEKVQQFLEDPKYKGLPVIVETAVDRLSSKVDEYVKEHGIDLIVMGTKGSGGLEEILIGSNAEKIVRHSTCPVITVRTAPIPFEVKNIVFATNCEEDAPAMIHLLKGMQRFFDATLHLVTINTPAHFQTDRDMKKKQLEFAEKCELRNFTLNIYNDSGEESGIIYFADEIHADLIALGTHGRSGLARLLSGSIAEDVVNHAKRPVLTLNMEH